MGKYDYDQGPEDWKYQTFYLCSIANELAEANRLKRLEMEWVHGNDPVHTEDKAVD